MCFKENMFNIIFVKMLNFWVIFGMTEVQFVFFFLKNASFGYGSDNKGFAMILGDPDHKIVRLLSTKIK
jgi:hypothetical protein